MKNLFSRVCLVILLFVSFTTQSFSQELNPQLKGFESLLGEYDMEIFAPQRDKTWKFVGKGEAKIKTILGGTFMRKEAISKMGNTEITMESTIGFDKKANKPTLLALDKEYGVIDFYEGSIENAKIIFDNLASDMRFETQNGDKLSFRLTFSKIEEKSHEFLVEFSKDEGKTWLPYVKQKCIKKGK